MLAPVVSPSCQTSGSIETASSTEHRPLPLMKLGVVRVELPTAPALMLVEPAGEFQVGLVEFMIKL